MRPAGYRGRIAAAALTAGLLVLPASSQARGDAPDRAFRTPVAHGAAAAHTAVSSSRLAKGLSKTWKRAGRSGAYVLDAATNRVLFRRSPGRARILASNSKIFTTSTAVSRFGPDSHLATTVWSTDDITDGISQGLYLKGMGDPTLSTSDLTALAGRVRAAGVLTVLGPLFYDDSFLDHQTGVPEHGITSERVGTLSALTLDGGGVSDPARTAAQRFEDALRRAGVSIGNTVTNAQVPVTGAIQVAEQDSPTMASLIRSTNVPSNNFMAEMLMKDVGGAFGGGGSTSSGVSVVRGFASDHGASFSGENGSGLTRVNKASPASVGRLLYSMLKVDQNASAELKQAQEKLRDAFVDSLAVAGQSGTLANRMRHTAASGRCHAKTGTLDGVSALSGYCFKGGDDADHAVVFSILNNSVDVNRAHMIQDRMAALIARYSR
jgi:D-alanyl-D-alanine carboxypeptidase/D-alanyl-D-alanine-endopeptidase (penicillin-binding protein 4)